MLKTQNCKSKLVYIGFGSLFGCLFTIIGMLASPVTAQRDKFGEIECTKLTVVDAKGKPRVLIATDIIGGYYNADTIRVRVIGNEAATFVATYGKDGKSGAALGAENLIGGHVAVYDKDGERAVELIGEEYRKGVRVYGENRKRVAVLGIDEYGNGAVSTFDKNGIRQ